MGKTTMTRKLAGYYDSLDSTTASTARETSSVPDYSYCQLLQSKDVDYRILDSQGFTPPSIFRSNAEVSMQNFSILQHIIQVQDNMELQFARVLYFLPVRGPLEKAEGYLQEELRTLDKFIGPKIFESMVFIATIHERLHKLNITFTAEDESISKDCLKQAFHLACPDFKKEIPPIIFIAFNDNTDMVRRKVKEAKFGHNLTRIQFKDLICLNCGIKLLTSRDTDGLRRIVGTETMDGTIVDIKESFCHPAINPHVLQQMIRWFGMIIGYTYEVKMYCTYCNKSPSKQGCYKIGTKIMQSSQNQTRTILVQHHIMNRDVFDGTILENEETQSPQQEVVNPSPTN